MKWFLVFLLMPETPDAVFNEYYKLNTEFSSEQECVEFVSNPYTNYIIKDHMKTIYPLRPVENVWCVREDIIKEVMGDGV